jgi:hypothetical protein
MDYSLTNLHHFSNAYQIFKIVNGCGHIPNIEVLPQPLTIDGQFLAMTWMQNVQYKVLV